MIVHSNLKAYRQRFMNQGTSGKFPGLKCKVLLPRKIQDCKIKKEAFLITGADQVSQSKPLWSCAPAPHIDGMPTRELITLCGRTVSPSGEKASFFAHP